MQGHYHYDCDEYCEDCLPVADNSEGVDLDDGEQDTPAHCCNCHKPLDCRLTTDGAEYVFDAIQEELSDLAQAAERHKNYDGTWYEDSPHIEILFDWANLVYAYTPVQRALLAALTAAAEELRDN